MTTSEKERQIMVESLESNIKILEATQKQIDDITERIKKYDQRNLENCRKKITDLNETGGLSKQEGFSSNYTDHIPEQLLKELFEYSDRCDPKVGIQSIYDSNYFRSCPFCGNDISRASSICNKCEKIATFQLECSNCKTDMSLLLVCQNCSKAIICDYNTYEIIRLFNGKTDVPHFRVLEHMAFKEPL